MWVQCTDLFLPAGTCHTQCVADTHLLGFSATPHFLLIIIGLVYRGAYMVNWSPKLGTAVSDLEVEYSEEPGFLYFFR